METQAGAESPVWQPVGVSDHVHGSATASVTLVEYGDYECPYCHAAVATVEELQRVLPNELRFIFRHFPLENLRLRARRAAEAAEAAASHGKFFEMHAALFATGRAPGPRSARPIERVRTSAPAPTSGRSMAGDRPIGPRARMQRTVADARI